MSASPEMKPLLNVPAVRFGEVVSIVAPASFARVERLEVGTERLRSLG